MPYFGPVEAGRKDFTLMCMVQEVTSGIARFSFADWWTESGPIVSGNDITFVESVRNASSAISTLLFSPLHTSHAGMYPCHGRLVNGAEEIISISSPVVVTVKCMCMAF